MAAQQMSRRSFTRATGAGGAGLLVLGRVGADVVSPSVSAAVVQGPGLSDPARQPKFATLVPNALDPAFVYDACTGAAKNKIKIGVGQTIQFTGLVGPDGCRRCLPRCGVTAIASSSRGRDARSRSAATSRSR